MNKPVSLLVAVAVGVAAPAAALAKKPADKGGKGKLHNAKVLRGSLSPARTDVAAYTAYSGSAQLVANKRNANAVVKVRRLAPGVKYTWALVAGDCSGAPVEGLRYKAIRTGDSGNGTGNAKSKKGRFRRDLATGYSVVVMQTGTTDEVLLCGALAAKKGGSKGSRARMRSTRRRIIRTRPGRQAQTCGAT